MTQAVSTDITVVKVGSETIEASVLSIGAELLRAIGDVVSSVSKPGMGPVAAARALDVDKVLMSRVLKALRAGGAVSGLAAMPGPDPLRRLVTRAVAKDLLRPGVGERASAAIDAYERLIKDLVGDRSRLDSLLSAWAPGSRREFELRRKQAAVTALSQIKGVQAEVNHATVIVVPSAIDLTKLDVVWVTGFLGLTRLRPGARVVFASRRLTGAGSMRRPMSLAGTELGSGDAMLVREFCSEPMPQLRVSKVDQTVFYSLQEDALGAADAVDVVYGEVNRAEIERYVPTGSGRRGYFFAEVNIPCVTLQFDVLAHRDLFPGAVPELCVYDTAFQGIANVNDRARDMDKLDLEEMVDSLGPASDMRSVDVPRYRDLLEYAAAHAGIDMRSLRGYRCRVDYPLYGSQVTMAFAAQER